MKLFIFDVDGTLVDSQAMIVNAMTDGYAAAGLAAPARSDVLSIVGRSLPEAVADLLPEADPATRARVVEGYKAGFFARRAQGEDMPLYPGAQDCLTALDQGDWLLGMATGKSRRGIKMMLDTYGWRGRFVTTQAGDENPSKPAPEMLFQALRATGVDARDAVMIGDTVFDIQMGVAAGLAVFGVAWGYHPADALMDAGARLVAPDFPTLTRELQGWAHG
ncbi:MAG: HAD-IA family hydrolase [Paracoccus sp. (in: a-proteobacteria)]|uniref:HAD-IA family hydrolase n=1 Tax=Paracoccus sp. TaxID=267 RepID=UPI0026DFA4A5|nr:HAD-IA family hydrolase [Paracoccus sp. (in: a-proteobacteria)]MDO5620723.1 HAD-IA family hydrolase [Paracoccus sp. (in: a-proteobacteria)]